MSSPEEPASSLSIPFMTCASYSSSALETYAVANEKDSVRQHVRRTPMRHRAWWLLLSMTAVSILFTRLVWTSAIRTDQQPQSETPEAQLARAMGGLDAHRFILPADVRVVALVSYIARSRTSILDCYLQSNLAINDGLLDQIIFVPETGQERDMDWLYALVQSTPGYFLLGKPKHDIGDDLVNVPITGDPGTEFSEQYLGVGPFARSWNLALSTAQTQAPSPETQDGNDLELDSTPSSDADISTVYIFVHGETIFLAADAISHLLHTHFTHPSYAFIHANVVNQPVLSWIHHHLGVVLPYRPETEPPVRFQRKKTAKKTNTEGEHPWRASELPLWRDSHRTIDHLIENAQVSDEPPAEPPQDFPPIEGPNLFNIPIDFHSPFRGHRWLPYHPHDHHLPLQSPSDTASEAQSIFGDPDAQSISTPITQAMMSLQRPGKWPWTLSALHLYSFLELLECTPLQNPPHPISAQQLPLSNEGETVTEEKEAETKGKHYQPNCTTVAGLQGYNMGLWEYQSEKYGMSLFAMDSHTVKRIGPLPHGISETEILGRAGGKGAAIDGGSMAVRFVGSTAEDGVSEKRGLESTDLLERFTSVSREVGRCDVHGVLR